MGKGHRQRPAAISQRELEHNWFVVFGQPYGEPEPDADGADHPHACPCGDPVEHDHF